MFDNDILIENVRMLMSNNKTTQNELSYALGMSQPNFNRALNQADGKRFTIEQIFGIASYYGVSIDWLMGNTDSSSLSDKAICDFLSRVVISKKAKIWKFEMDEAVVDPICYGGTGEEKIKTIPYTTIYFPKYLHLSDYIDENDYYAEAANLGNNVENCHVNTFIEKFARLYNLYRQGDMDEEDFQTLLQKHLDSMSD